MSAPATGGVKKPDVEAEEEEEEEVAEQHKQEEAEEEEEEEEEEEDAEEGGVVLVSDKPIKKRAIKRSGDVSREEMEQGLHERVKHLGAGMKKQQDTLKEAEKRLAVSKAAVHKDTKPQGKAPLPRRQLATRMARKSAPATGGVKKPDMHFSDEEEEEEEETKEERRKRKRKEEEEDEAEEELRKAYSSDSSSSCEASPDEYESMQRQRRMQQAQDSKIRKEWDEFIATQKQGKKGKKTNNKKQR